MKLLITINIIRGPNLFPIINNLLATSKIFKTLLDTDLNFVNTWANDISDINNIKYRYKLLVSIYCTCNHIRCECNITCDDICNKCQHRFIYCKCSIKCKKCNKNSYESSSEDYF